MRFVLLAVALASLAGCGEPKGSGNAPADHTESQDGVMHKPGARDAPANCVSCHGADLGGGTGPSCIGCHARKW